MSLVSAERKRLAETDYVNEYVRAGDAVVRLAALLAGMPDVAEAVAEDLRQCRTLRRVLERAVGRCEAAVGVVGRKRRTA